MESGFKMKQNQIINFLEKPRFGIFSSFFWFLLISFLRYSEEMLFFYNKFSFELLFFFHLFSFFLASFLLGCLLITLLSKERPKIVLSIVLFFLPIILLPPVLDKIVFNNHIPYSYILRERLDLFSLDVIYDLVLKYKGIAIELTLYILFASGYVWIKTKSIVRTSLIFICVYILEILFLSFPEYHCLFFKEQRFNINLMSLHLFSISIVAFIFLIHLEKKRK